MGHIHTNPGDHDYTVGAYIVNIIEDEPKVLLHLHKKMDMLLPIGGHVELNETIWQALGREVNEESGYLLSDLVLLQPEYSLDYLSDVIAHPYPVIMSDHDVSEDLFHSDTAYAFVTKNIPSGLVDEGESQDFRWLNRTQLESLNDDEIFPNTKEIYLFILDVCLDKWKHVPSDKFKI